jgi:hypothetical protein
MKSPAKPCFTRCDGRNQSKFYCQHFKATVKAKSANVWRSAGFSFQSGKCLAKPNGNPTQAICEPLWAIESTKINCQSE